MARSRSEGGALRERSDDDAPVVANGWTLLFHPLLLDQLETLTAAVQRERAKRRTGGTAPTANVKVLEGLRRSMFERVPGDPARAEFRQGDTLGAERRHWFRAKFGAGRFRLFFRFRTDIKVIVYVWVNDSRTLRAYGSKTDAYAVFRTMLDKGTPPETWDALVSAARTPANRTRAKRLVR